MKKQQLVKVEDKHSFIKWVKTVTWIILIERQLCGSVQQVLPTMWKNLLPVKLKCVYFFNNKLYGESEIRKLQ